MKQEYPEPIVGAFIFNPKGEILVFKSHKWPDMYVVPGGHIEVGETLVDALKREVLEETGLNVSSHEFINIDENIHKGDVKKRHFIFINYKVIPDGTTVSTNDEAQNHAWIMPNDLLQHNITDSMKTVLKSHLG